MLDIVVGAGVSAGNYTLVGFVQIEPFDIGRAEQGQHECRA